MFSIFGSKKCIGVDIGTNTLKVVQLKLSNKRYILENYVIVENKEVLSAGGGTEKINFGLLDDRVANVLKEAMKKAKIDKDIDAVVSLPAYLSFTTVIELPKMSLREVAQSIEFEARKYIPIPINEVLLDWQIVDSDEKKTLKTSIEEKVAPANDQEKNKKEIMEVVIVAVPLYLVEKYKNFISRAGLKLKNIELENFSLVRSILGNDRSPAIIVDFGAQNTDINLVRDGVIREVRTLDINGNQMTRALSKSLGISIERAEVLKKERGLNQERGEQEFSLVLLPIINIVIEEIERIRRSFFAKKNKNIERIVLIGGPAKMPGLVEYFSNKLEAEVGIGNPFSRVIYPQDLNKSIVEVGAVLSVAAGLAMRELSQ